MIGGGGIAVSIVVFAVGAILDFAVTVNTSRHGFDVHTMGVILMIVGAIGFVLSLLALMFDSDRFRRRSTVIDDSQGNVVRREDRYS